MDIVDKLLGKKESPNHNKIKYHEIWALMQTLREEEAELLAKRRKYTNKINKLYEKIEKFSSPIKKEIEELSIVSKEDLPRIREVRDSISNCAKAMGGKRLSDN